MMTRNGLLFVFLTVLPTLAPHEHKARPPGASHFSILGVTIGQDTLETLENKLGKVKQCDSHDNASIAGYTDSKEDLVFVFGEVGGGDVTAFYLTPHERAPNCPLSPLPRESSGLTTRGGIRLGMTEEQFIRVFGPPKSRTRRGQWKYFWTWKEKLTDEEKKPIASATPASTPPDTADVSIWIKAQFSNGVLRYFFIAKLETV
jgi:hypothetical protein